MWNWWNRFKFQPNLLYSHCIVLFEKHESIGRSKQLFFVFFAWATACLEKEKLNSEQPWKEMGFMGLLCLRDTHCSWSMWSTKDSHGLWDTLLGWVININFFNWQNSKFWSCRCILQLVFFICMHTKTSRVWHS